MILCFTFIGSLDNFVMRLFLTLAEIIYVRVYEERMDLLRAVLVGAPGTPYHDGLFFFDIFLPSEYPYEPPVSSTWSLHKVNTSIHVNHERVYICKQNS